MENYSCQFLFSLFDDMNSVDKNFSRSAIHLTPFLSGNLVYLVFMVIPVNIVYLENLVPFLPSNWYNTFF